MSNFCSLETFEEFLNEIKNRYEKAREGYNYDFELDIKPFLMKSKEIAEWVRNSELDSRFTSTIKDKVMNTTTELAMSCHITRFSKKLFNEMYKYISHWFFYIHERDL